MNYYIRSYHPSSQESVETGHQTDILWHGRGGLDFPVLRPLIGLDKLEIISIAKEIGTYDWSIMKTSGCAAVPVKPVTEAKPEKVAQFQEHLGFEDMVDRCVRSIKRVR